MFPPCFLNSTQPSLFAYRNSTKRREKNTLSTFYAVNGIIS